MKHLKITGLFNYSKSEESERLLKHARENIAINIGKEILENELIHFEKSRYREYDVASMSGDVVVIRTEDYERLMKYIFRMGEYVFYDRDYEEEVKLLDLL